MAAASRYLASTSALVYLLPVLWWALLLVAAAVCAADAAAVAVIAAVAAAEAAAANVLAADVAAARLVAPHTLWVDGLDLHTACHRGKAALAHGHQVSVVIYSRKEMKPIYHRSSTLEFKIAWMCESILSNDRECTGKFTGTAVPLSSVLGSDKMEVPPFPPLLTRQAGR